MEPLKLIYDGYEIEIKSGGIGTMPIITMKKMVTNIPEEDVIKLPRIIEYPNTTPPWWENPPIWWNKPYCTYDSNTFKMSEPRSVEGTA